ncbi:hypothetical protein ACQKOH_18795 [Sphingomonas sp. NPDC092331]|jgi:hypothetical protein|uniref:hypothetical protein n=1 Tax=unclassified Sphingomonas TaxID=196159 RepID=UPI0029F44A3F|nr:hypothetical protein [Pseudomonadota bacterium]
MIARLILASAAPFAMAAQDVPALPRAGILCELALNGWFEQIATRCKPAASPAVQAAFRDGVVRIGQYVRARSKFSEADLAAFVRDQGGGKLSDAELCDNDDARDMQVNFGKSTPEQIRAETDKAITGERKIAMDPCL